MIVPRRRSENSDILLVANMSRVPEIRNAMIAGISTEGMWTSKNLQREQVGRDWLHWPCALEDHPWFSVRPYFIRQNLWRRFQMFGPEHPRGIGQRIDLALALAVFKLAPRNGYILATTNLAVATALYLKKRGMLAPPLWCLLHGMADRLDQLDPAVRVRVVEDLHAAGRNLVWGLAEADYLRDSGLRGVEVITFGVDTEFWTPADGPRSDFVLSVGWDGLRDYETLAEACPYHLKIVTSPEIRSRIKGTAIEIIPQPTCRGLRRLYRDAKVMAVITRDSLRPSGQISILQAMACGRPVIATRTRGIWTDKLVSGVNCILVPEGDACALRDAIRFLWENPAEAERIGEAARMSAETYFPFDILRKTLISPFRRDS